MSPVQTTVINHLAVPRLCNVDFAVDGPCEWFVGEEPERRPDAGGGRAG